MLHFSNNTLDVSRTFLGRSYAPNGADTEFAVWGIGANCEAGCAVRGAKKNVTICA